MISIIIPLKDEKNYIFHIIEDISRKVRSENEILIIYDYDGLFSEEEIQNIENLKGGEISSIKILRNKYGSGALNAIKTGVEICKGDPVVFMTADLSDDPEAINRMIQKISEGFDIVCGSRFSKGGRYFGGSILKRNLAKFASLSLHYITGIPTKDITNTFKMFRKNVIQDLGIKGKYFEWSMRLTLEAFLKGYKISEVPCSWREIRKTRTNFKWRYILNYLMIYICYISRWIELRYKSY